MKSVLAIVFLVGVVCVAADARSKLDSNNVNAVLSNKFVLQNYLNCMLDTGKCTQSAQNLKDHLIDALKTNCKECTSAEKRNVKKVITYIRSNRPRDWVNLKAKYDPEGKFGQQFGLF